MEIIPSGAIVLIAPPLSNFPGKIGSTLAPPYRPSGTLLEALPAGVAAICAHETLAAELPAEEEEHRIDECERDDPARTNVRNRASA